MSGKRRFGDTTSNMVEQFNNVLRVLGFRSLSVIHLINALLKYMGEKFWKRKIAAQKRLEACQQITSHAEEEVTERRMDSAQLNSTMTLLEVTTTSIKASFVIRSNPPLLSHIKVRQTLTQAVARCGVPSCGKYRETGIPCIHILAAIDKVRNGQNLSRIISRAWNHLDKKFYHKAWHSSTYLRQYEVPYYKIRRSGQTIESSHVFTTGDEKELSAPPLEAKKGRKKRERKYKPRSDPKRVVICKGCGQQGHMMQTCPHPKIEVLNSNAKISSWVNSGVQERNADEEEKVDKINRDDSSDEDPEYIQLLEQVKGVLEKRTSKKNKKY